MIKYLKYELKKNIWTFCLLTAICTILYVAELSSKPFINSYNGEPLSPSLSVVVVAMTLLTFIVPVLTYSFKMNKRSIDGYYALPLKREKLYLVKTIVGLLLVFVPFTIAYWCGFIVLLFRSHLFQLVWYLPAYFGFLLFGLCAYGLNAFVFTRGNRVWDGIVLMMTYAFIGLLIVGYIEYVTHTVVFWRHEENFSIWGPMIVFCGNMERLICNFETDDWSVWTFLYPIFTGGVSYFLLFFNLRFEKGENAEQVSESWFGYKLMIPLYVIFTTAISELLILNLCMTAVGGIVATVIWRHRFRFSWKYWVMIGGAILVGVLLNLLCSWTAPIINPPEEALLYYVW